MGKNIPIWKTPGPDSITGEFCQSFKKEIMPILHRTNKMQEKKTAGQYPCFY
jgi:hypothetical protein